jgi:hypothetical protein
MAPEIIIQEGHGRAVQSRSFVEENSFDRSFVVGLDEEGVLVFVFHFIYSSHEIICEILTVRRRISSTNSFGSIKMAKLRKLTVRVVWNLILHPPSSNFKMLCLNEKE